MCDISKNEEYMSLALAEAEKCPETGDVPVGAVIIRHGEVISYGRNRREIMGDATCHAELEAIRGACAVLGGWHLTDCEMYVTLEPCPMCAGAVINSRIDRVIIGAKDNKGGAFGSLFDILSYPVNHRPEVVYGVMEDECSSLLRDFFREKRERGKRWGEKI